MDLLSLEEEFFSEIFKFLKISDQIHVKSVINYGKIFPYRLSYEQYKNCIKYEKDKKFISEIKIIDCHSYNQPNDEFYRDFHGKIYKNVYVELCLLPEKLEILNCWHNSLHCLPDLPDTLLELYCGTNMLTELPKLPKKLRILSCGDNLLTYLPDLPETLEKLDCSYNDIDVFPIFPKSLKEFIFEKFN
jgi:Leucine-rich repeat (LRR) protein